MPNYVRISNETFEKAKVMLGNGESVSQTARTLGIGASALSWRLNKEDQSLSTRKRIIEALRHSDFPDSPTLLEAIRNGTSIGIHEVQHILFSLNKQGLITFDVNKKNTNQKILINIKASNTLRRTTAKAQQEQLPLMVETTPEPVPTIPEPVVEENWPELNRILEIEQSREETKPYVAALLESATVLASFDEEESNRLETKANAIYENLKLSPVEFEYLKFAKAKGL